MLVPLVSLNTIQADRFFAGGFWPLFILANDPNGLDAPVELNTNDTVTIATPSTDVTVTPEPSSFLLMGGALALFAFVRRRQLGKRAP